MPNRPEGAQDAGRPQRKTPSALQVLPHAATPQKTMPPLPASSSSSGPLPVMYACVSMPMAPNMASRPLLSCRTAAGGVCVCLCLWAGGKGQRGDTARRHSLPPPWAASDPHPRRQWVGAECVCWWCHLAELVGVPGRCRLPLGGAEEVARLVVRPPAVEDAEDLHEADEEEDLQQAQLGHLRPSHSSGGEGLGAVQPLRGRVFLAAGGGPASGVGLDGAWMSYGSVKLPRISLPRPD